MRPSAAPDPTATYSLEESLLEAASLLLLTLALAPLLLLLVVSTAAC